jgi:hypothetical protein
MPADARERVGGFVFGPSTKSGFRFDCKELFSAHRSNYDSQRIALTMQSFASFERGTCENTAEAVDSSLTLFGMSAKILASSTRAHFAFAIMS